MPTGHLRVHPEISFADPIYVPSIRLDDWLEDKHIENIDFIWMDVQGAELDVFSGASNAFSRTRYLYTEYAIEELYRGQPSLKDVLAALPQFKPVIRYLNDVLLCNRDSRAINDPSYSIRWFRLTQCTVIADQND